ncbi:MAG: RsmB/NOP family class I SAM-dependent RNA methyltransferase [Ottowia sp.]|nr:RsmB/NOP family class I SAM-dependent RNA methyltransferase [Ottowia sp.]
MVSARRPLRGKQDKKNQRSNGGHLVDHIERLLAEVLQFVSPADVLTSRYFRQHPQLGQRERGVIAESVFAVLRRKIEFSQFAESGSGSQLRRLAILGLAASASPAVVVRMVRQEESVWLDHLRKIDRASLSLKARANLPEWILTELQAQLDSEQVAQLAQVLQEPAPLDVRVNTVKCSRAQLLSHLADQGMADLVAQETPFSPDGLRLVGKPALSGMDWFADGWAEVQDEGSQLLAYLLAPKRGEMVVDFCAGAGGKTLALGALMRNSGRLYALDVAARRLAKFKPRLARSGLSNVHPVLIDSEHDPKLKRMFGKVDRVLVDAPCSGLGTLRRNPELKWRQSLDAVAELNIKQVSILNAAAKLLKPGGRLVYATCSLMRAENKEVVDQFLATHPEFVRLSVGEILRAAHIPLVMDDDLVLWPHTHQTDGFYAAVLQRN